MNGCRRLCRIAAGLLILVAGDGCSDRTPSTASDEKALSLDLTEAAYRYLFDHNASAQGKRARFYCLAQGEFPSRRFSAPPAGMTRRLADVMPPVLSYPACEVAADSGVVAGSSQGTGIIFYVSSINCENNSRCKVTGGYYEGNLSASEQVLRLEKTTGDHWKIVGEDQGPIA